MSQNLERRPVKPEELQLDVEQTIVAAAAFMRQEDRQREMAHKAKLPLLELPYERLDEDFAGAMRDVLAFLELDPALADGMQPPLQKLRDDASASMIETVLECLRDSDRRRLGHP